MKFYTLWMIFLLFVINLEPARCFKCEFGDWGGYYCNILPDSISTEEKHADGKTDNDADRIEYSGTANDVSHLTQSELNPIFHRFKHFSELKIHDVKSVDENLLQQSSNFKEFHINVSEITELPEKLFLEVPNLTSITLDRNKFSTMPENLFLNQKQLKYLFMRENLISCLPSNIFKSLTKLKELKLYNNMIQSLNPEWFETLQSLEYLHLSDNRIQDLPKKVFGHLEKLKVLNLHDNQLTTIHSDSFGIHNYFWNIDLKNNKIVAIDEKIFDNTAVMKLDMRGNVCSNEELRGENKIEIRRKLIKCFRKYRQREASNIVRCGKPQAAIPLIVNGAFTKHNENPWQAALVYNSDKSVFCGATLVSNKHVVTAAHCMHGKKNSYKFSVCDFSAILGAHNLSNTPEKGRITSAVQSIKIHPDWDVNSDSYDADIAILELANEVTFNKFIKPVCVPDTLSEVAYAISGTVIGFGITEAGTTSDVARKLEIPIYQFQNCTKHNSDHKQFLSPRTFCGGTADGRGVCSGDSGSGVYVVTKGRIYLRGIVSASLLNAHKECDVESVAIFTDVPAFYGWIKSGGNDKHAINIKQ